MSMSVKKVSDEIIIESYNRLSNVWKVGEEVGLAGQTVWDRLTALKLINPKTSTKVRKFKDWDVLLEKYSEAVSEDGGLQKLADSLGRTKHFLCRKAKELGLTDISRQKSEELCKKISTNTSKYLKENGHPKGMLGKTHNEENKKKISERTKIMWEDPNSKFNSEEHRQKLSDRASQFHSLNVYSNPYSRCKHGHVQIADKKFFLRSSWEANIAAYIQDKKEKGLITDWDYECDTFWFEKIKRGVRSYKPDFKIFNLDGSTHYIEVKGWMDAKSKTKLQRMKKYHPSIKIELIDKKRYNEIAKGKSNYKYWGGLD